MSNIENAKAGLRAEIKQATAGMLFYTNRIAELEKLSQQLDHFDTLASGSRAGKTGATGKRKYTKRATTAPATKKGRPAAAKTTSTSKRSSKSSLPATGTGFWKGLMSSAPISNKDILAAGVKALAIQPQAQELQKLKQRLANFLTMAAKDGAITSTGSGRARRFALSA